MLPEAVYPEGRISVGEALLFPNLSGFGAYSGVCIFSKKHFLALGDFTEELIYNALKASQIYFQKCAAQNQQELYPSINGNYLLPAGSSILHPHLQPFLDPFPTNVHRLLIENSNRFFQENTVSFWNRFKEIEKRKEERFLTETGSCFVYVPFAPVGFNEVNAIIGEGQTYLDLPDDLLKETAVIIKMIMKFYEGIHHNSFNLTLFSPVESEKNTGQFPCLLKMCSRPAFQNFYRNDVTFFEKFHLEAMLDKSPERVAEEFRATL
jgi:galactose-1-phosphate uridylyltransferase